jgi:hypothetical protein
MDELYSITLAGYPTERLDQVLPIRIFVSEPMTFDLMFFSLSDGILSEEEKNIHDFA